jgi:hypothetical protein
VLLEEFVYGAIGLPGDMKAIEIMRFESVLD